MSGASTVEQKVLDLADAGKGSRVIAAELGLSHKRVMYFLSVFGIKPEDRWEAAAREGSRALLVAIERMQGRAA